MAMKIASVENMRGEYSAATVVGPFDHAALDDKLYKEVLLTTDPDNVHRQMIEFFIKHVSLEFAYVAGEYSEVQSVYNLWKAVGQAQFVVDGADSWIIAAFDDTYITDQMAINALEALLVNEQA